MRSVTSAARVELEDLPEVDPVADEVALDRDVPGDERDRRNRDHAVVADDRVEAALRQHLQAGRVRLVAADEVDHDVGSRSVRQLPHLARDVVPLAEHLVGAELAREPPAPLVGVDRDDRRRAENLQELEGDVADAADADQDRGRARTEARYELLDRVHGGEPGVGMRRDLRRLDPGRKRDERPLVHEHVVGEAAVARQPGEPVPLAVHVDPRAGTARRARSCTAGRRARRRRRPPP